MPCDLVPSNHDEQTYATTGAWCEALANPASLAPAGNKEAQSLATHRRGAQHLDAVVPVLGASGLVRADTAAGLLRAILWNESLMRPDAVNRNNRNRSVDVGERSANSP
jgi:hypothetical protein